jgi:hypothetical protein
MQSTHLRIDGLMVFKRKVDGIVIVHNDIVYGIETDSGKDGRCTIQLPLDQLLNGGSLVDKLFRTRKGKYQILCILPDHWFGIETYPLHSRRANLIEPYLERRLAAAHPDLADITQFFNYTSLDATGDDDGILAYFLQDEKAYHFYEVLEAVDLAPGWITSPGFLWTESLFTYIEDFNQAGTLLIHVSETECLLYFFFQGHYLFSRSVILSDTIDSLEAVVFEINQSLYLFSQKTKSELSRFLLLVNRQMDTAAFGKALGHDIIAIDELLPISDTLAVDELTFLSGLLRPGDLNRQADFFSITQRQIKQHLAWRPVQWSGIVIGFLLLLFLIADNIYLNSLLGIETSAYRRMQTDSQILNTGKLTDYEAALGHVLSHAVRPSAVDTIGRLIAGLPESVRFESLDFGLSDSSIVVWKAVVKVKRVEDLRRILTGLVKQINADFKLARELSLNDIDIINDDSGSTKHSSGYGITVSMELI